MKSNRLILFEGIPGSGKTTTAQILQQYMMSIGIEASVFIEGSEHPIDLPFHAYFHNNEFEDLLHNYPEQEEWLNRHSIIEEGYILIPYKTPEPEPFHAELIDFLGAKEFCYSDKPVVSFTNFKTVFERRFKRYADIAMNNQEVIILESALFQHQIHDINRLYPEIAASDINEYITGLAEILRPLNPVLFYLSQNSVSESLEHTAQIRSKPHWWTAETIKYYTNRKSLELDILKDLPIKSIIIDNTKHDWDNVFNIISSSLNLNFQKTISLLPGYVSCSKKC
ncbi:hypothetical protein MKY48_13585 [Paenibacillus sp. FSL W8-0187]|uniref:hypothetical protein n=1 Tax=Paenibacillus sp. FSL W8-0187 TaxID=2921710 RepID=UPI0030DCE6E7